MKLCLNSIVKNEAPRIIRMLASMAPHITCWAITDTGSTDGTPKIIEEFFRKLNIPGAVTKCDFEDFSQARNFALFQAQHSGMEFDYIILVDADMELKVVNPNWTDFFKDARAYDMYQLGGMMHYQNRRLVKKGELNGYRGVTHEYLDVDTGGCLPKEAACFIDHADGSNRKDKFIRDIKLLKRGLKKEPDNVRYMYYIAQSYRECGKTDKAIEWYEKRIKAGGWDEEIWSSKHCLGHCYREQGREAKFVRQMLEAYNYRPSRAEPLYDLARYFREKSDQQQIALVFAEKALQIPKTGDALFVNDYVYECGAWDEFAIAGYYAWHPATKMMAFKANNMLSLKRSPYAHSRELARDNMFHYMPALKDLAPSFEWQKIDFTPEENWIAMNPCVTVHGDKMAVAVRTVNYRMDEHGRYLIRGLADGTVNNSNPINTRTFLVTLKNDMTPTGAPHEILMPPLPCEYPLVVGFEDMRIFSHKNELWSSSTCRQIDKDGLAEQVLAKLTSDGDITTYRRMLRTPRLYEKNWSAITHPTEPLKFMYRPGHVVDDHGQDVVINPTQWDIGHLSGGSQCVSINDYWLYITHEARFIPGTQLRFYMHRFVKFDKDFKVTQVSVPFYFREKVIEFAAGMCLFPKKANKNEDRILVISFGFKDCEPCIGTVKLEDVERFLGAG